MYRRKSAAGQPAQSSSSGQVQPEVTSKASSDQLFAQQPNRASTRVNLTPVRLPVSVVTGTQGRVNVRLPRPTLPGPQAPASQTWRAPPAAKSRLPVDVSPLPRLGNYPRPASVPPVASRSVTPFARATSASPRLALSAQHHQQSLTSPSSMELGKAYLLATMAKDPDPIDGRRIFEIRIASGLRAWREYLPANVSWRPYINGNWRILKDPWDAASQARTTFAAKPGLDKLDERNQLALRIVKFSENEYSVGFEDPFERPKGAGKLLVSWQKQQTGRLATQYRCTSTTLESLLAACPADPMRVIEGAVRDVLFVPKSIAGTNRGTALLFIRIQPLLQAGDMHVACIVDTTPWATYAGSPGRQAYWSAIHTTEDQHKGTSAEGQGKIVAGRLAVFLWRGKDGKPKLGLKCKESRTAGPRPAQ